VELVIGNPELFAREQLQRQQELEQPGFWLAALPGTAVSPFLISAELAAGFAFCLVVSVVRWAFVGARGTYLVCKKIIKAFMPVNAGSDHEAELDEEEDESAESSPYQILGVTPGLSSSELNARYRQLMSANHPDKVAQLDPETQAFASERSRRIIEAYEAISAGEN
jgi:hypothetical protein